MEFESEVPVSESARYTDINWEALTKALSTPDMFLEDVNQAVVRYIKIGFRKAVRYRIGDKDSHDYVINRVVRFRPEGLEAASEGAISVLMSSVLLERNLASKKATPDEDIVLSQSLYVALNRIGGELFSLTTKAMFTIREKADA